MEQERHRVTDTPLVRLLPRSPNPDHQVLDFDSIYRRYWQDVLRFSLYLCGNTAEAEDLAATTFLRALTSTRPVRLPSVKAYLFVVARNLYRDHLRRIVKRRSHELTATHP